MSQKGELQTSKGSTRSLGKESHWDEAVQSDSKRLRNEVEQICTFGV